MDAGVSVDKSAHLADLKRERSLFESCLHLSGAKKAEVASVGGRSALAELRGNLHEVVSTLDLADEVLDVSDGLFLGAGDGLFAVGVVGVAGPEVLLQNVANADL